MALHEEGTREPSVMVLGGDHTSAIGVVRSLGRSGIPVFVGGLNPRTPAGFSRFVSGRFRYSGDSTRAHEQIVERLREWRPTVLLPIMDHAWSMVYSQYDDLSEHTTVVPCPNPALRSLLNDKASLLKTASAHGVPTPRTYVPSSLDEALTKRHELPYPVLLKPRRGTGGVGIRLARDPTGFEDVLRDTELTPMIQEYIDGEDLELTILADHGEPLAGSAYVTLRNRPLPYGPPVACRTVRDERLMSIGMKFLQELRYHGVAHLDFRRDRRDGQPKLLDFNIRLAGSNEISTRTGVDFALMLSQMAVGRRVAPCFEYEVNAEFRWLMFGEVQHLIQTPRKRAVIRDLMRWRNVHTDVSLTDPLPHMIDTFNVIADKSLRVARRTIPHRLINSQGVGRSETGPRGDI